MTTVDSRTENYTELGSVRERLGPLVRERFGLSTEEFLTRYEAGEYRSLQDDDASWVSLFAPFALAAGNTPVIVSGE